MALATNASKSSLSSADEKQCSLESTQREQSLLDLYPEYQSTSKLDTLRETEYAYLDKQNHVYLDYTGSGLAAQAQYRAHEARLSSTLHGNPHSVNPTSEAATRMVEEARTRVLKHFNASPKEYTVIFTPNATGAAKLIGEAYPFSRRNKLVLTADNHNSVNGLREYARRKNSRTVYIPSDSAELRIDPEVSKAKLSRRGFRDTLFMSGLGGRKKGLFAYPAQSNFSGVRHPLSFVRMAQEQGYDVLLDTAAYLPTAELDLAVVQPEFLMVSWYKLFGYPTGLGCLICKRSALARLKRPWFSGGTIRFVAVQIQWHSMAPDYSAFEDGTVNFLSIPDIVFGLDWLEAIGMDTISTRVKCLTGWFLVRLMNLRHSNGRPMIRIYGPKDTKSRGGTVTFNFLDVAGRVVDERLVAKESSAARISLRTGCFCNPGCAEYALNLGRKNLMSLRGKEDASLDVLINGLGLPSAGCIRVSFGLASNVADVDRFFDFAIPMYRDRRTTSIGLEPRDSC